MKNTFYLVIIGCLLGYLLFFNQVSYKPEKPIILTDTITVIDTVRIFFEEKKNKPIPTAIIGTGSDEVKIYSRNILPDTLGTLIITDSVWNNELLGYSVSGSFYQFREIKNINSSIYSPTRNKWFIGLNFMHTPEFITVFPTATFLTNSGLAVSGGYDFIHKAYFIGVSKQLHFKSNKWKR